MELLWKFTLNPEAISKSFSMPLKLLALSTDIFPNNIISCINCRWLIRILFFSISNPANTFVSIAFRIKQLNPSSTIRNKNGKGESLVLESNTLVLIPLLDYSYKKDYIPLYININPAEEIMKPVKFHVTLDPLGPKYNYTSCFKCSRFKSFRSRD